MEGITYKEWTISPHFPPVVSKLATGGYKNNVYHPIAMLLAAQALNDIMYTTMYNTEYMHPLSVGLQAECGPVCAGKDDSLLPILC